MGFHALGTCSKYRFGSLGAFTHCLYPDENSEDKEYCTAFSGSAIVDDKNLLGKQQGEEKTLVAFYTSQHCGQRIAYSTDKGRTWEKV
jgi:fructan beta-fructosidase